MKPRKPLALALLLTLVLTSCGGFDFGRQVRLIVAAAGPLIESLNLGGKKAAVIADFTELGGGAADLSDAFASCGTNKPCKLTAVGKFADVFDRVSARGNLGSHVKLQRVQGLLHGVIASAKIYYGGGQESGRVVTEKDLKTQMDQLQEAMKPDQP